MSMQQSVQVEAPQADEERARQRIAVMRRLHMDNRIALGVLWVITAIVSLLFISIIIYLIIQGAPALFSANFYGTGQDGIAPELFNTFYILILTEIFLFPISLAAAIFLIEYARRGPLVTIIHFAAETLAGVPSIVLGLFGFAVFAVYFGFSISRLAGALTLLCLNFPQALRLFEASLESVPHELREGSLALGATKWRMIRTVVLPSAMPGLVTGLILTAGKIIGEAAALLFTMGLFNPGNVFTLNPLIASDTLTTRLYYLKGPGAGSTGLTFNQETVLAAGIAAILILFLLVLNLGARGLGRLLERRLTAA
ncbi:MAG TPA: phosphate ABC transporter permease PstA [Ktedonobacteraceae bacterium]|nr:phosphate ABC transporter permease PstA [Ktedonobacteraceae bacterium]